MKQKIRISFFIIFILISCENDHSEKKDLKVLIVGNSITYREPIPERGWYGNWGMAASAPDKDFESLLTVKMTDYYSNENVIVSSKNISFWELNFDYDLNQYTDISNKVYDILIVRLGENIDTSSKQFKNYESSLTLMINHFKTKNTKVIITGNLWSSLEKDLIQEKVAKDNNYKYISLIDFQNHYNNYAYGQYEDDAVSNHPSDTGMVNLANLIFDSVISIQQ
ncbi:hypothetical protein [Flavobacterium sp. WC2509]|uniref:hypothetical protein n=1 Tax=Flavobacterium sp. WC2509 TaxID=3461406 RepID=UPI004043A061